VLDRHAFLQAREPLGVDVGLLLVLRLVALGCAGEASTRAGAAGCTEDGGSKGRREM